MNRLSRLTLSAAAFAACAAPVLAADAPQGVDAPGWYATGSLAAVLSAQGGDPVVSPGAGVRVAGTTDLGRGRDFALAGGREFRHEREGQEPLHTRLEVQWRDLSIARDRASVGLQQAALGDHVKARALFLDGLVRFARTENTRWWAGAGIGTARVDVPGALAATPGCSCLNPARASGTAWQVKLVGERLVSADGAVFGELGYVRLPSVASSGTPSTAYGRIGAVQLGIGWRSRF